VIDRLHLALGRTTAYILFPLGVFAAREVSVPLSRSWCFLGETEVGAV
jgi:hypothetical protein